jgi:hypothetical protein
MEEQMDTGNGEFVMANDVTQKDIKDMQDKYPNHGGWFKVGDTIKIRGSLFRVKTVKPKELRLKLLARED